MSTLLLVANPAASGFTGGLHREVVARLSRSFAVETVWPTSPDEAEAAALGAAHRGCSVVAAMGGDGVAHHVVNGIVGTDTALGIIPAGTTNVLARILGVPERPRAAARYLASHPPAVWMPLAGIELRRQKTESLRYATFGTGIGFDASVVEVSNAEPYRKYWFGGFHYARSATSVLLGKQLRTEPDLSVEVSGRTYRAASVLVQVHTPYTYFGSVPLRFLDRRPSGLAALIIERFTLLRSVGVLLTALAGRGLDRIPGVHVVADVDRVDVDADHATPLQADGELLGAVDSATFSARPHSVRVVAPTSG